MKQATLTVGRIVRAMFYTLAWLFLIVLTVAVGRAEEVPPTMPDHVVDGGPLTAVVVTQCNLVVAVYLTMQDGKLLRIDKSAGVPIDRLLALAYSAARSERVEVSCNSEGVVGFEGHRT